MQSNLNQRLISWKRPSEIIKLLKLRVAILFLFVAAFSFAQQEQLTRILFVFDASNSMNQKWGRETRIEIAKKTLIRSVDSLRGIPNLEIGLRVYGHQSPITATYQDCEDTKLEAPFATDNHDFIINKIKAIRAKGTTPIARSLEAAAGDFPDRNSRNIIILITDGIEACDDEPCVIADKLRAKGISISPFVIGLGMDMSYLNHFDCYGNYKSAETEEEFKAVLKNVINIAVVNTSVQINLNTIHKKPLETDVTMFLYEAGTNNLLYTFTHTLNEKGLPDTLIIDPNKKYDLIVNTLPRREKRNITIKKYQHNIIEVDAPQGFIEILHKSKTRNVVVESRIMLHGETSTLNAQKIGTKHKYIVGKYDVEVFTLPRRYYTVDVTQSSTSKIMVEAPGTVNLNGLSQVTGQIFEVKENNQFDWVCNLREDVTSDRWDLQPGNYLLVYRKQKLKSSSYTNETRFTIHSNKSISINL